MFYILNNCSELDPYATQHRTELIQSGCHNVELVHRKKFQDWVYRKLYFLRKHNPDSVLDKLFTLVTGCDINVQSYSACIVNGVRFLTQFGAEDSVVLFKCKWFTLDSGWIFTRNNITSINISAEAWKDDPFILATQAKQVFYVGNPSRGANWRVVQDVHHTIAWTDTSASVTEIDLTQPNLSSNFTLYVDLGNLEHVSLRQQDGEDEHVSLPPDSEGDIVDDDDFIDDDELEDETLAEYDEEGEAGNSSDSETGDGDVVAQYESD